MMLRPVWLLVAIVVLTSAADVPAAPRADRCTREMVATAGREADQAMACEAALARTGTGGASSCGTNAFAELEEALGLGRAHCGRQRRDYTLTNARYAAEVRHRCTRRAA